jgi:hypothetical protein
LSQPADLHPADTEKNQKTTFVDLPYDIYVDILTQCDPVTSTCLALGYKPVYPIHRKIHGTVHLFQFSQAPGTTAGITGIFEYYLADLLENWMTGGGYIKRDTFSWVKKEKWVESWGPWACGCVGGCKCYARAG